MCPKLTENSGCVAEDNPEVLVPLLLPPEFWDYSYVPLYSDMMSTRAGIHTPLAFLSQVLIETNRNLV